MAEVESALFRAPQIKERDMCTFRENWAQNVKSAEQPDNLTLFWIDVWTKGSG